MKISGSVALVTGANRGIGQAFVSELLHRGASKIYIAARDLSSLTPTIKLDKEKLIPLQLDLRDARQIEGVRHSVQDVKLLVNNAGLASFDGAMFAPDLSRAREEMEVNYFAPLALTRALQPVLGGGAVLNMLSMAALVSLPVMATYSASKAALLSVTRSMRAELASDGIQMVGVLAVQTETSMGGHLPQPRMQPQEVARDALEAVEAGVSDEICAGLQTRETYRAFLADPKAFQARMLGRLAPRTTAR